MFPPAVICAALIGLERHARLHQTLTPQQVAEMTAATLKLVNQNEPTRNIKPDVYSWMRLRAAGVLAQLGSVGKDNEVYLALLQLTNKLPALDDRCEAAALLARLNYEGAKLDGAATTGQVLQLAMDVGAAELAHSREFDDMQTNGFGMGGRERAYSGGRPPAAGGRSYYGGRNDFRTSSPTDPSQAFPRRPLAAHLLGLRQAISVTRPLVAEDSQKRFDQLLAAIDPVIQEATDKDAIDLSISAAVRKMAAAIDRIAAPITPPASDLPPAATDTTPEAKPPGETDSKAAPPADAK